MTIKQKCDIIIISKARGTLKQYALYERIIMTISEFLKTFVNPNGQKFQVWSDAVNAVTFIGYLPELPIKLLDTEITSIDNIDESNYITINIEK